MQLAIKCYLSFNAVMYLVLGIWCAVAPDFTAQAVGLAYLNAKGFAEYTAVYGGLEFGVGVFYLLSAVRPALRQTGVLFSVCFYASIAAFRSSALLSHGSGIENGWYFYFSEVTLAVVAVALQWKGKVSSATSQNAP